MREVLLVMAERRFGCVGIVDGDGALIGIITDGDLSPPYRRRRFPGPHGRGGDDARPKIAAPDQLAAEALAFMNDKKITRLFVLEPGDDSKPVGILHIHDCLRAGLG